MPKEANYQIYTGTTGLCSAFSALFKFLRPHWCLPSLKESEAHLASVESRLNASFGTLATTWNLSSLGRNQKHRFGAMACSMSCTGCNYCHDYVHMSWGCNTKLPSCNACNYMHYNIHYMSQRMEGTIYQQLNFAVKLIKDDFHSFVKKFTDLMPWCSKVLDLIPKSDWV